MSSFRRCQCPIASAISPTTDIAKPYADLLQCALVPYVRGPAVVDDGSSGVVNDRNQTSVRTLLPRGELTMTGTTFTPGAQGAQSSRHTPCAAAAGDGTWNVPATLHDERGHFVKG